VHCEAQKGHPSSQQLRLGRSLKLRFIKPVPKSREGEITEAQYEWFISKEIETVVRFQEKVGLLCMASLGGLILW